MGSCPIPDMSLVRWYRASLWMEDDSLRAVATRMKPAPLIHDSERHLFWKKGEVQITTTTETFLRRFLPNVCCLNMERDTVLNKMFNWYFYKSIRYKKNFHFVVISVLQHVMMDDRSLWLSHDLLASLGHSNSTTHRTDGCSPSDPFWWRSRWLHCFHSDHVMHHHSPYIQPEINISVHHLLHSCSVGFRG